MIRRIWWLPIGMLVLLLLWHFPFFSSETHEKPELPSFVSQTAAPTESPNLNSDPALLPYLIPQTPLIVESFLEYEGPYPEDLTDEETVASAIVLHNGSDEAVTFVRIEGQVMGKTLIFEATHLPAGAKVLIVEKNRQLLCGDSPSKWSCPSLSYEGFGKWDQVFSVEVTGPCTLSVTNRSGSPQSCLRVYYKQYYPPRDLYIGGITYCTVLPDVALWETRTTSPYRYAAGYSKVVMITP